MSKERRRGSKKAQFFLIASVVIAFVLLGLGATYVATNSRKEDTRVYDLSKEISFESSKVIDSGVFNALSDAQINENLFNLSVHYAEANPQSDIRIYYGDGEKVYYTIYNTSQIGEVGINTGTTPVFQVIKARSVTNGTGTPSDGTVKLILNQDKDVYYNFNLTSGQNFFIVLKNTREDEATVAAK